MVPTNKAAAIFHPVRIRVLQALFGRNLTAQELQTAAEVPSLATLYRHLKHLVDAEILAVVEERPVRGAIEKVYGIANNRALMFQPEEWQQISAEDQLRFFNTLIGSVLQDFGRYIAQPQFNRGEDGVITRQMALNLTREEARQLSTALQETLAPFKEHAPDSARQRYMMTNILLPVAEQLPTDKEIS
ncbi:MAG: helix-turn-helix domain-containing protein [Armatimonas sp.]